MSLYTVFSLALDHIESNLLIRHNNFVRHGGIVTIKTLFFAACMVLTSAAYAATSAPVALGTFGDWEATSFKDNKGRVCFMASVPKKERGAEGKKRGEVRLFITHWAGEGSKNVVGVDAGSPYR